MKDTKYAYATANIRAMETRLLDKGFFERILSSPTFDEAKRMAADKGFSALESTADPLEALGGYMQDIWDYVREIAPTEHEFDFLIVKNDFHNLKAATKSMFTGADAKNFCISPSLIEIRELCEKVENRNYDLPPWIAKAAQSGYELLSSTMNGQLFDMYADRCSIEASLNMASDGFAKELANTAAALTDIKTALRMARVNAAENLYDYAFAECDDVDPSELKRAALKGYEHVVSYIENGRFSSLAPYAAKSVTEFEKMSDNYVKQMLDVSKTVSFGPEPIISYYLAKETELKNLRIALSAVHARLDKNGAAERLRELYV